MIKIQGGPFVDVNSVQGYDNMSNPELQITIEGGFELTELKETVDSMKLQLDAMTIQQDTESALRKTNPALQELYDQYQMVYTLVKKTDDAINGNDGGG